MPHERVIPQTKVAVSPIGSEPVGSEQMENISIIRHVIVGLILQQRDSGIH